VTATSENPSLNYYFPDFEANSCGFGRNYPVSLFYKLSFLLSCYHPTSAVSVLICLRFELQAWMGQEGYAKWYLFRDPLDCCRAYYPGASNCPYQSSPPPGFYYWEQYQLNQPNDAILPEIYNHTFYPELDANTCVNGTDYPVWMVSSTDFKQIYLFHDIEGCCEFWFAETGPSSSCARNVIQGTYENITATTNMTAVLITRWYPMLGDGRCVNDGAMPSWMLEEGFTQWYLFTTHAACCAAFGFC
jgi:hypothetical protein